MDEVLHKKVILPFSIFSLENLWAFRIYFYLCEQFQTLYALIMLTKVIDNKGNILAERECTHVVMARMSSARMIRKSGEVKKSRTVIVSTPRELSINSI